MSSSPAQRSERRPIAEVVVARTGSVHLSVDAVEEAILACGLPSGWKVGIAAYEATRAMAEQKLRLGHNVIVDAVNDSEDTRQTWRTGARERMRGSSSRIS